jgi:hypothetical protein
MMKDVFLTISVSLALVVSSAALSRPTNSGGWHVQDKQKKNEMKTTQAAAPAPQALKPPLAFGLQDGTPIKLRITRTISSADAKVEDTIDFEILEETKIGDVTVIPKGGIAWGTVTEAQAKRRMGRAGKLNVNIDSARLVTGEKVALRAVKELKGGGNTGKMTGAMVATGIVFFPAAPLFLFMHGKDITIPKGTEITAYISGDAELDPAKFAPKIANTEPSSEPAAPAAAVEASTIVVKSTPDGAEITVDGKFVGSTPSTLRLIPGEHSITIEKSGFKVWQRAITVSSAGSVTVEATLDKSQ